MPQTSFFRNLLDRRVPHIFGIYLAVSWGILQFMEWLVDRFVLSPHLPIFCFAILVSLIPTALLLAYFHGKPGRDQWTKVEKIGIPVNLIFTAAILFFIFQGKDLGAASSKITIEDETGTKVERVVPKNEFRKRIALFYFENASSNTESDWLQYGINELMSYDLSQDLFLEIWDGHNLHSSVKRAGFPKGVNVPLTLKRKICNQFHIKHFVSGSLSQTADTYSITISLYETKRTKLISENTFEGENLFNLVDEISVHLKSDLEIPEHYLEEVQDLPVSEMLTNSPEAFKLYILGDNATFFENDYEAARKHLEKAVQIDSIFASAQFELFDVYFNLGLSEQADRAIEITMQHLYKLPEKAQFQIKSQYYFHKEQIDKQFALFNMWTELYPNDVNAHLQLGAAYSRRTQFDQAITEYKKAYDLDPEKYFLLHSLGALHFKNSEYNEALQYFHQYAEEYPGEARSFSSLGNIYNALAEFDKAKQYYEKANIIEPDNIRTILEIGHIENKLGNFEQAEKQYQNALSLSKTAKQRSSVYKALSIYYETRGETGKAFEHFQLHLKEQQTYRSPIGYAIDDLLFNLNRYVIWGQTKAAVQALETAKKQLPPTLHKIMALGRMLVHLELNEAQKAQQELDEVDKLIDIYQREDMRHLCHHSQGRIHEINGEFANAIASYQEELKLKPLWSHIKVELGRCYRNLQQLGKAENDLQEALKTRPFDPKAHYEMALVQSERGNQEKALEHLKTALDVWQNADAEYEPAKLAREKLAEWQS